MRTIVDPALVFLAIQSQARAKVVDLQRENSILKKAVQIQNSKLNEKASTEQELQQLRHLLTQYQEQVWSITVQKAEPVRHTCRRPQSLIDCCYDEHCPLLWSTSSSYSASFLESNAGFPRSGAVGAFLQQFVI